MTKTPSKSRVVSSPAAKASLNMIDSCSWITRRLQTETRKLSVPKILSLNYIFCIFIWERLYAELPTQFFVWKLCATQCEEMYNIIDTGLRVRVTESRQLKQICRRTGRHEQVQDKEEHFSPSGVSCLNLTFPFW